MPRKVDPITSAMKILKASILAAPTVDADDGLDTCASTFARLRGYQEQIKTIAGLLAKESDRLSYDVLPTVFEQTRTESPYNHVTGRLTLSHRVNVKVLDKDKSYAWLRKNGLGDLIIETIPWQTIGAVAADRIAEGKPDFPADLFETKSRIYTSFTPAKE